MSRLVATPRRIEFVFLRTVGSLPAALHPASRRRSYLRLRCYGLHRHGLSPCCSGTFTGALIPGLTRNPVKTAMKMKSLAPWAQVDHWMPDQVRHDRMHSPALRIIFGVGLELLHPSYRLGYLQIHTVPHWPCAKTGDKVYRFRSSGVD